jgi:hypothetical protein
MIRKLKDRIDRVEFLTENVQYLRSALKNIYELRLNIRRSDSNCDIEIYDKIYDTLSDKLKTTLAFLNNTKYWIREFRRNCHHRYDVEAGVDENGNVIKVCRKCGLIKGTTNMYREFNFRNNTWYTRVLDDEDTGAYIGKFIVDKDNGVVRASLKDFTAEVPECVSDVDISELLFNDDGK